MMNDDHYYVVCSAVYTLSKAVFICFTNNCDRSIWVAVSYVPPGSGNDADDYITDCWYDLDPGDTNCDVESHDDFYIYFYAAAQDESYYWDYGNFDASCQGESFSMFEWTENNYFFNCQGGGRGKRGRKQ